MEIILVDQGATVEAVVLAIQSGPSTFQAISDHTVIALFVLAIPGALVVVPDAIDVPAAAKTAGFMRTQSPAIQMGDSVFSAHVGMIAVAKILKLKLKECFQRTTL